MKLWFILLSFIQIWFNRIKSIWGPVLFHGSDQAKGRRQRHSGSVTPWRGSIASPESVNVYCVATVRPWATTASAFLKWVVTTQVDTGCALSSRHPDSHVNVSKPILANNRQLNVHIWTAVWFPALHTFLRLPAVSLSSTPAPPLPVPPSVCSVVSLAAFLHYLQPSSVGFAP